MTYFIYTFTGGLCNYFSCVNLLANKLPFYKKAIIFFYTFGTLYFLNRRYGQAATFITLLGIFLLTYLFSTNRFFNLSCYLFGYLYIVAFNYLFMWGASLILKMDMEALLSHDVLIIIFSCVYSAFCGVTTKFIGWCIHKKLNLAKYMTHTYMNKAVFIDLFVLVCFYIFNFSYGERLGYNYGVIALNGIMFLLLFSVTVFLMYSIYKVTLNEQTYKYRMAQFENLRLYTEQLEKSYGIMRKFKHDYMNILSTMSGYMEENDMNGLSEYYGKRVLPISRDFTSSDTKLGQLANIKNTAFKSLLSSKFIYMFEIGMNAEIELTEPIKDLVIDCLDLSRIMGIFLDNAIEAAMDTDKKEIIFCMFYKDDRLYIIIKNTALVPEHPISELNCQGVSSKGESRGFGLHNVSMILNNYDNTILNTSYEEPYFTQELILIKNVL